MTLKQWTKKKPGYVKKKPVVTGWLLNVTAGIAKKAPVKKR
jgi:hypothetical protein